MHPLLHSKYVNRAFRFCAGFYRILTELITRTAFFFLSIGLFTLLYIEVEIHSIVHCHCEGQSHSYLRPHYNSTLTQRSYLFLFLCQKRSDYITCDIAWGSFSSYMVLIHFKSGWFPYPGTLSKIGHYCSMCPFSSS